MKRRNYLVLVGCTLTAGCSTPDGQPETPTATETPPSPTASPTQTSTLTETRDATSTPDDGISGLEYDPDSRYETVEIGDRDAVENPDSNRQRSVCIWNATESPRQIDVEIVSDDGSRDDEEIHHEESYEVPNDADIAFELLEPANYTVTVESSADDSEKRFRINQESFDCNWHEYRVTVHPDGHLETTQIATTLGCLTPES